MIKPYEFKFRHYTSDIESTRFNYNKLKNQDRNLVPLYKPSGLWGSPIPDIKNIHDFYTWKMWLENEGYEEDTPGVFGSKYWFDFGIKEEAKILTITRINDIDKYKKYVNEYYATMDNTIYDDYDGIFLYHGKDYFHIHMDTVFNSWDVDSIVVWNPDMIIEL